MGSSPKAGFPKNEHQELSEIYPPKKPPLSTTQNDRLSRYMELAAQALKSDRHGSKQDKKRPPR
jgi:hypothetical protein